MNLESVSSDPVEFLRIIHPTGSMFEIRIPKCPERRGDARWPKVAAGFFQIESTNLKSQIDWAESVQPPGIYVTINPCKSELYALSADRIALPMTSLTNDPDIIRRCWLFLDIDSKRRPGISATDQEVEEALALGQKIKEALASRGWPIPLVGMSGNGCYLGYRIELPNDDASSELVETFLKELAHQFDNDAAHVDTATFNASRVFKILGTTARKGSHVQGVAGIEDRPHRQSWFQVPSAQLEVVPVHLLQAFVADAKPVEASPWKPPTGSTHPSSNVFRRCVSYLAKMEPSIEGANGSARAIAAACVIARFGLEGIEARQAFETFNQRCQPPWSDREVEHKLADGRAKVLADGTFGSMVKDEPHRGGTTDPGPSSDYYGDPPVWLDEDEDRSHLPQVILPGLTQTISDTATALGKLLSETSRFYDRGGAPVRLVRDAEHVRLEVLKAATASSDFDQVARLYEWKDSERHGPRLKPAICKEPMARQIISAEAFHRQLPTIRVLSHCPVLIERDDQLVVITGFDRESGIWGQGQAPEEPSLEEAVRLLENLFADFNFATPNDRSRALAAIITPALVFGGLLKGRAPVDLGEADDTQAGKGYRNKLTAAIYRHPIKAVTQREGGVGSIQETFDAKLISGASFISLDNVRGKFDIPGLESFLTEPTYPARIPYLAPVEIETSRVIVMMTTNRAEITPDFANRSSIVRIRKQPEGYVFPRYPEGELLNHVVANQPRYLGAVFAVVREWFNRGKPVMDAVGHDFRPWAGCLGWILEHLFQAAPLLDGHRQIQRRVSSGKTNWLRDVFLVVKRNGKLGQWLRPGEVLDLVVEAELPIHGIPSPIELEDEECFKSAARVFGRKLSKLAAGDQDAVDGIHLEKDSSLDEASRPKSKYRFSETVHEPDEKAISPVPQEAPSSFPNKNAVSPIPPVAPKSMYACAHAHEDSSQPTGGTGEIGGVLGKTCDHLNPEAWVHRDGLAYCPGCDRFMGRVPSKSSPDLSKHTAQPINGAHVH